LTDNNDWRSTGQGKTGEVLLVGEDRLLRSQSRFLIENPDKFVAQAKADGLSGSTADQIRALGTTILYMPRAIRSGGAVLSQSNRLGQLPGLSGRAGDLGLRPGGSGRPALGDRRQAGCSGGICTCDPPQA
jgi:hypothetical protein